MSDIEIAFNAIKNKQDKETEYFNYYNGDHPLVFAAKRLKDVFKNIDVKFSENWCAVVVDSVKDRVELQGLSGKSESETNALNELWSDGLMDDEAADLHESAFVTGEGYIIVWPDQNGKAEAFYNDPRKCHLQMDAENPKKPAWGAKMWITDEKIWRLNLYYADRIEKYATAKRNDDSIPSTFGEFKEYEEEPVVKNEYGIVPVFKFGKRSELKNIIPLQAAVNKLLSDMMVSAEFGTFKQRWIISNVQTKALKNSPNEIWEIPAGDGSGQDTEVGEFNETDLNNFINAMNDLRTSISTISKTPKHYFFNKGGDPSGESLIAMEAPLNKKCDNYIKGLKQFWREVVSFMALINNLKIEANNITPIYAPPETVQPKTEAEIIQAETGAGIPLKTALKRHGWTDAEIKQMEKDKQEEQLAQAELAQAYMDQARRNANEDQV